MKKLTLLMAVVGIFFFASCGGKAGTEENSNDGDSTSTEESVSTDESSDQNIVGTWNMSEMDFGKEIPAEQKEMFDKMVQSMIENTKMTFNEDGTYSNQSMIMGQLKEESGTYSLDGMTLTTTNAEGKEDTVTFTEFSSEKFIISLDDNGQKMSMTFTK